MKIMGKPAGATEYCLTCNHYGYCAIYWGAECKRQGGRKTPRMKSKRVPQFKDNQITSPRYIDELPAMSSSNINVQRAEIKDLDKYKYDHEKPLRKKIDKLTEPIRTWVANW